jgi:cobyrinic acid a,c-diamide synthase
MGDFCPRIVIAGTASGVGKTSLTLALVAALRRRGMAVQTFKVGPDFLDPTHLALASGRECFNLDGWMAGREYVQNLFARETASADIAVVEGVMGLYDGADSKTSEGSTAEIAGWLSSPIMLVVNARGMARSIAATVKGYSELEAGVNIACVMANHTGSTKHSDWLADALDSASLPPLAGSIPKGAFPELPGRHLGLVPASEGTLKREMLEKLAAVLEENSSVDEILRIARNASTLESIARNASTLGFKNDIAEPQALKRVKVGVAFDDAFHFYYADTLKKMESLGCEIVKFSPLKDTALPEGLDGIYMGGGYPELWAENLSDNKPMLESVKSFAESGRPLYAECGGLLYLSESVETVDGKRYPLAGVLRTGVRMRKNFKNLGYVEATLTSDTIVGKRGAKLRGHRFHYSELESDPSLAGGWDTVYSLRPRRSNEKFAEGFRRKGVLASYMHTHLASDPAALNKFIESCEVN